MKKHVFVALFVISAISLGLSDAQAGGCPGNCNGNGVCDGGTNTCICNVGFIGVACDQCGPNYYNYPICTFCEASSTCSGNGTCNSNGGCNCSPGYSGSNCIDNNECVLGTDSCSVNSTCVNTPGSFECLCDSGFAGPNCDQCAPDHYNYPTCVFCEASVTCSGNGTCTVTGGCICNSGYTGVNCENGPPAVPTVSEWGLAALTLTGLIAGTLLFTRRTKCVSA